MRITKEEAMILGYALSKVKYDLVFDFEKKEQALKAINKLNDLEIKLDDYSLDERIVNARIHIRTFNERFNHYVFGVFNK